MKKAILSSGAAATFSLADYPSGARAKLEEQIVEHAIELWRRKRRVPEGKGPVIRKGGG